MAGSLQKVVRGQPLRIPADSWNTLMDVARAYNKRPAQRAGDALAGYRTDVIRIRNDTGVDVNKFEMLMPGAPVFVPPGAAALAEFKQQRHIFTGAVPLPLRPFCVMQEPVADGAIGRGILTGVAIALVAFTHDKMPYADGDTTVATLEGSGDGYAKVLWKESGTGDKWAVLLLGAGPRGYFPVDLATTAGQTSGANGGNKTTTASWTYTVSCPGWDGSAAQLGTAVAPETGRWNGKRNAATRGQAYYEGETLRLWTTNETAGTTAC
jgi:hypothetical protein